MKPLRAFPCIFIALMAIISLASCRTRVVSPEPDLTPPAEVSSLAASVTNDSITLSWIDPSDADFSTVLISWNSSSIEAPKGAQTATLSSLSRGSEYLITVRTRDSSGNVSTGSSLSIGTITTAAFVISVEATDEPLYLSGSSVFSKRDTLSLSLSGVWNSYAWHLDGTAISGATGATLILPLTDLGYGNHMITVMLMRNGALYSKDISFKVGA